MVENSAYARKSPNTTMKKLIFSKPTAEAALAVAGLVVFYLLIRLLTP